MKINEKEAGVGPFFKKALHNKGGRWDWAHDRDDKTD